MKKKLSKEQKVESKWPVASGRWLPLFMRDTEGGAGWVEMYLKN